MLSPYMQQRQRDKNAMNPEAVLKDPPKPKSLNQKKPKPRSKKLAREMRSYIPEMKKFLEANTVCQINMPGCAVQATCVHHTAGRTGPQLRNQKDWKASCGPCNLAVEVQDKQARELGHKKQRNGKPIRK